MATSLSNLFVTLGLDANPFVSGIKAAQQEAREFEKGLRPIKQALIDVGAPLVAVGGAVTAAFIGMSKQAANYGDAIRDASIRTGISTETLSGLKFAAEQTGTSFESINTGLIRMSRNALAASEGTGQAARAFETLGVSVKDSAGQLRSQDAILLDVAEAFSKMEDGTRKAALAQQLFGRGGAQMIEFLNQGEEGLLAFQQRARELGLEILPGAATAADKFNDSLNELQNAQLGLSNTIGQILLPGLTRVVDVITGVVVEFRKFAAEHPELIRVVAILAGTLLGAGGLLVGLAGVLAILPALGAAFAVLAGPVGIVVAAIGGLVTAFAVFPQFRGVVLPVLEGLAQAVAFLGSYLASLGQTVLQLATGQFKAAWTTFATSVDRGFKAAADAGTTFDSAVTSVGKALSFTAPAMADTSKLLKGLGVDFDATSKDALKMKDKAAELAHFLRGAEDNLDRPIKQLNAGFALLDQTVTVATPKIQSLFPPLISDMEMLNMALDSNLKFTQRQATDEAALAAARQRDLERYQQALKQATDDVKRSAGEIFDAMFIKGENVFTSLGNLLKGGALSLGRAIFEDVVGALLGPVKLAFDNFFKGILDQTIGGFAQSLGSKLGGLLPGIGGTAQTATGVAGTAAGGVGGAGGALGGATGGAGGLASGFISGGLSFAGSIVGALMSKGNAKRTEENTRETRDLLEIMADTWNPLFHAQTIYLQQIAERLAPSVGDIVFTAAEGLRQGFYNALWEVAGAMGGIRPELMTAGADVVPGAAQTIINAPFNNHITLYVDSEARELTDLQVRDMMAQITTALDTGVRGYAEKWAQIITQNQLGLVGTPAVTGI